VCSSDLSAACSFPRDKVPDYVGIGQNVPKENIHQYLLSPTAGFSMYHGTAVCLFNDKLAAFSIKTFGTDSLWYGKPAPGNTCPS
jgi:hypothetical protein